MCQQFRFLTSALGRGAVAVMTPNTILITGASSGIGAALAKHLAKPGTHLILWGRDESRLADIAQACRQSGAIVTTASVDVSNIEDFKARLLASDTATPLTQAIFNAGLGGTADADRPGEDVARVEAISMVNFVSPIVGATMLCERMAARGGGHIVLIGSVSAYFPLPMAPTYASTKAGLAMFAESLRMRMAKHNVAVTLVSPGFIDTPMSRAFDSPKPFLMTAETFARIIAQRLPSRPANVIVPWQYAVLRALSHALPRALTRAIINRH